MTSTQTAGNTRIDNRYDPLRRQVLKQVSTWDTSTANWVLQKTVRFTYDGWNVIEEEQLQDSGSGFQPLAITRHIWGMDVSGTLQGAGGVGGLLKAEETIGTAASSHYPWYDGNGNVVGLMRGNGTVDAVYRYSAFGGKAEVTVNSSTFAARNPYRFSTKYLDAEVETTEGTYYYGYWHYATALGRWPNRDPIAERGGLNLYGMVGNNPVNFIDYLGLAQKRKCESEIRAGHGWHTPPPKPKPPLRIEANPPNGPGDRCTAVSCFSGNINDRNSTAVSYPDEQFDDPNIPDFNPDGTWNPSEPGYLTQDEAYPALVSAINAAKTQAEADCGDKETCCSSIIIKVNCQGEAGGLDFQKLAGKDGRPVLCGKSWTLNCKTKKWNPADFPKP
jgi:RHS repeat-associated protein